MNSNHIDFSAGLAYVAGGGLAAVAVGLSTAFPTHAGQIAAYSSILIAVAGLLLRLFYNRTIPPSTQPVIASTDAPSTLRVKDLTTPSAVEAQKE